MRYERSRNRCDRERHGRPQLSQADGHRGFFDRGLTEVAINRPGEIWTQGANGWQRHEAPACTLDACFKLANALTVMKGGHLVPRIPIHPVVLPDGQRGHVLMQPACEQGTDLDHDPDSVRRAIHG